LEKKEVVWTLPAKADLQNIFYFLSEVSETVALKIIQKILARTLLLEKGFSKIGQQEPLLKTRKKNYRYLIEGNYKIIYNEQDSKIIIHAVFDVRQNPKKLKKFVKQ
jgi:toxin ParE1/3/4